MSNVPVTKRSVMIAKRSDMSLGAFNAHWSGPHTLLAIKIPGAKRYVQHHIARHLWLTYDNWSDLAGLVEFDYGTHERLSTSRSKMTSLDELLADEETFLGKWSACTAVGKPDTGIPSQRRIVAILKRPEGVTETDFEEKLEAFIKQSQSHCDCYYDVSVSQDIRLQPKLDHYDWPHYFIYFNIPSESAAAHLTSPDGPILHGLSKLTTIGGAFYCRVEAKLLDGEADVEYWELPASSR